MESKQIEKAISFIRENLNEQISLSDIAVHAGYSPYHFSRAFYKKNSCTVMEFVRMEQMKAALQDLKMGEGILTVALKYGFDTHAGFTNAFNRCIGCNPSVYRSHEQKAGHYEKGEINMDQSKLIIRLIQPGDVTDMWENVFSRNTPEEIKQRIHNYTADYESQNGFHVVAEVDKKVIGTLGLLRANKYQKYANLGDFVIHPDYQGKGIARKMLNETKELAKNFNIDTLIIQTSIDAKETQKKYESLGFTKVFESGGLAYLMMAI